MTQLSKLSCLACGGVGYPARIECEMCGGTGRAPDADSEHEVQPHLVRRHARMAGMLRVIEQWRRIDHECGISSITLEEEGTGHRTVWIDVRSDSDVQSGAPDGPSIGANLS